MFDLYTEITNRIIAELEAGVVPWRKSWSSGYSGAISHLTGKSYSLTNQLLLGKAGEWISYKQAKAEGGFVRKGQKSKIAIFWKFIEDIDKDTGEVTTRPCLRYYNLFHLSQVEGIKPRWDKPIENPASPDERAEAIMDGYAQRSGVKVIRDKGSDAFYIPSADEIHVPDISQFEEVAEFYSCLYHEATHSVFHESRLGGISKVSAFGDSEYSLNELVAELGSAFLVNCAGLETPSSFRNSSAYIGGWLKALQDDKRMILKASGLAEKATKYILGSDTEGEDESDETA